MAFLRAFGSWLPPRRVSNRELAPLVDATPEWILEVSGIEERRYAAETDTVAAIGLLAAQDCLEKAGATAAQLGMILVAAGRATDFCPGPASQIAAGSALPLAPPSTFLFLPPGRLSGWPWPHSLRPPRAVCWWLERRSCRAASPSLRRQKHRNPLRRRRRGRSPGGRGDRLCPHRGLLPVHRRRRG